MAGGHKAEAAPQYKEIEVRFLDIDKADLVRRLRALGAVDKGEDLLEDKIIYDKELIWRDGNAKLMRLRTRGGTTKLAYKNQKERAADGTEEIEFDITDVVAMEALLDRLGYEVYRQQQKKRHTFTLDDVAVDIDTWPQIPTYVELEGPSEAALQKAAQKLELDWSRVEHRNPRAVIEEVYGIPVGSMRWFTFDRFE